MIRCSDILFSGESDAVSAVRCWCVAIWVINSGETTAADTQTEDRFSGLLLISFYRRDVIATGQNGTKISEAVVHVLKYIRFLAAQFPAALVPLSRRNEPAAKLKNGLLSGVAVSFPNSFQPSALHFPLKQCRDYGIYHYIQTLEVFDPE